MLRVLAALALVLSSAVSYAHNYRHVCDSYPKLCAGERIYGCKGENLEAYFYVTAAGKSKLDGRVQYISWGKIRFDNGQNLAFANSSRDPRANVKKAWGTTRALHYALGQSTGLTVIDGGRKVIGSTTVRGVKETFTCNQF